MHWGLSPQGSQLLLVYSCRPWAWGAVLGLGAQSRDLATSTAPTLGWTPGWADTPSVVLFKDEIDV